MGAMGERALGIRGKQLAGGVLALCLGCGSPEAAPPPERPERFQEWQCACNVYFSNETYDYAVAGGVDVFRCLPEGWEGDLVVAKADAEALCVEDVEQRGYIDVSCECRCSSSGACPSSGR